MTIAVLEFEFGDSIALHEYLSELGYKPVQMSRMETKLSNIRDTVKTKAPLLTVDFVKNVHATLMKSLGARETPGDFRTASRAKPLGSDFEYHLPIQIAARLEHHSLEVCK